MEGKTINRFHVAKGNCSIIQHTKEPGAKHLIFYVHGFSGGIDTFRNGEKKHLHEYLDSRITSQCDFASFQYHSRLVDSKWIRMLAGIFTRNRNFTANRKLDRYASLLQTYYQSYKLEYSSVSFICHSMGGIVVKQCLIEENRKGGLTKGFYITLATPHQGVAEASALKFLGNVHIDELEPFSDRIQSLGTDWETTAKRLKTKYYASLDDDIVHEKSSYPQNEQSKLTVVEGTHTSICKPVTSSCALIKSLNIIVPQFLKIDSGNAMQSDDLKDYALFQGYRKECEPYYLVRAEDSALKAKLSGNHVWITGPSGCAKTVIGQRAIIDSGKLFFYIDASPCCSQSDPIVYLRTLYESIVTQTQLQNIIVSSSPAGNSEDEIVKQTSDILAAIPVDGTICVFIDEVSLGQAHAVKAFCNLLIALAGFHCNRLDTKSIVRFIVATPTTPDDWLSRAFKAKFDSMFKLHPMKLWTDEEIKNLLNLIFASLAIRCSEDDFKQLVIAAGGSPRRLKALARSYITEGQSAKKAILQVNSEEVI